MRKRVCPKLPTPAELVRGHIVDDVFKLENLTSRRFFLKATGAATLALTARPGLGETSPESAPSPNEKVTLSVNGRLYTLNLDPRTTLLDTLREHLGLTGSKKGCDQGQCGACTIIVNGQRINSCLALAVMHDGDEITTIEGLAEQGTLSPIQAAFVHHDGFQCGYCTPGQICSAVALLAEYRAGWPSYVTRDVAAVPALTDAEIAERMSGNICRCAAYPNIRAAIWEVAEGRFG
jgi:xanthine dehydrogenase YagT iron-sulfur-binding subunit